MAYGLDPNKLNHYAMNYDPFPILTEIQNREKQTVAGAPQGYNQAINGKSAMMNPDYMKSLMAMTQQPQYQPHFAPAAAPRTGAPVQVPMPMGMPAQTPTAVPPSLAQLIGR